MANEGIKSAFSTIGFQTYQPDPEDLCSLCGGNRGKESMIGCKDKIHVCMECVDLLAEIKQERTARKRDAAIEEMRDVGLTLPAGIRFSVEEMSALYDLGFRKSK